MWDLIVSVPDHCLSFYFTLSDTTSYDKYIFPSHVHYFFYLLHVSTLNQSLFCLLIFDISLPRRTYVYLSITHMSRCV